MFTAHYHPGPDILPELVQVSSHLPQEQGGTMYLRIDSGPMLGKCFYRISVHSKYPALCDDGSYLSGLLKNTL